MPFVNYNTKDLLLIDKNNQQCSCGCHGIIINQLMGRTKDITTSSTGKNITVGNIDNILSATENNIVIYSLDFSFHNKIIFRYTTFDDLILPEPQQTEIIKILQDLYENAYVIEAIHEKEIKPALSGKFEIIKKASLHG
jgi:phenylacetate-coenzyme A ligase PaaK-like adenylate-forming protein